MRCSHPGCNGNIVGDKCLQCGRPEKEGFVYRKRSVEQNTRDHTTKAGSRTGTCCNCARSMHLMSHDLCGACTTAVYHMRYGHHINLKHGTPRYNAALIAYREKRWPDRFKDGKVIYQNNLISMEEFIQKAA